MEKYNLVVLAVLILLAGASFLETYLLIIMFTVSAIVAGYCYGVAVASNHGEFNPKRERSFMLTLGAVFVALTTSASITLWLTLGVSVVGGLSIFLSFCVILAVAVKAVVEVHKKSLKGGRDLK